LAFTFRFIDPPSTLAGIRFPISAAGKNHHS